MKTHSILKVPVIIIKIVMVITIITGTLITFSLIHSGYSPAIYNKVLLNDRGFEMDFNYSKSNPIPPESLSEYTETGDNAIYLNKLTFSTKLRIWLQFAFVLTAYVLIMWELVSFSSSIKTYSSFFVNCTKTFKRLEIYVGILFLISFIVSIANFNITMKFPDGVIHKFNPDIELISSFRYLIFLFVLMILSSVFKEGERMKNEMDLTI